VRNVARSNTRRAFEKLYAADDLVAEYLEPERLAFYEEVASMAAPYAGASMVDFGCGTGNLLRAVLDHLAERSTTVERVLGLDYAQAAVIRTIELVPEAEGRVFDFTRDHLDGERFDLVLCTEVLEHVTRPQEARKRLAEACAPEGTILISVPDGAVDDWEGHVNFWSENQLKDFLEPLGDTTVSRIDAGRTLLAIVRPLAAPES
jgi:2-polyprenyl-3-methyl-5-hydroxy-6-metoxy-1,4-benzoquinol methylase